ncbi:MAG: hypothetical protein HRT69_10070 [Flavobacteriaceae bacterium]|nr:hypothetical protein [Flavobacteriaceae bacterium]
MKKLLFTLAIGLATLTSCESDLVSAPPSDSSSNDGILPTKVDIVYSDGETETITYTYDGMTLLKEESTDGYYTDYVYEDSKLTQINWYNAPNPAILESYTYDAQGRVATVSTNLVDFGVYNYNLSYNSDNSVITSIHVENPTSLPDVTILSNGNMIGDNDGDNYVTTFTHDTKNAPFKNINNRELLLTIDSENCYSYLFNLNNILTDITQHLTDPSNITNTYTYTDFDYPRIITEDYDGDISTYTYTYNND